MTESSTPAPRYGAPSRGISGRDVELAADACLREGERPTIEKIRERIGRGSPNTINPLLDAWWKRLAARLDAGPAALHRLPESVAHVAEALWMQALEEGRRRAQQELSRAARSAAQGEADLDLRAHVLSLREGELDARLKDRERAQGALELQLQELTRLLRKEQATREVQSRRIAALEEELSAVRHEASQRPAHRPTAPTRSRPRSRKTPGPRRRPSSAKHRQRPSPKKTSTRIRRK